MIGTIANSNINKDNHNSIIILVDSSASLHIVKQLLDNNSYAKVISFDYESHKALSRNNISHEISDNYLTEEDLQKIQKESYNLAKWYENREICKLLEYENINTGKLFYIEFHYFLLPFLKKFVELINIFKMHKNSKFIASQNLYKIALPLTPSVIQLEKNLENSNPFLYDSIKFRLTDSVSINIPRSSYLQLKKISEVILSSLSKDKRNLSSSRKSVLFVEFDPIRYEKLFLFSPQYSLNLILFNRRRPAVWNFKSYSIIKKSGIIVATPYGIINSKIKNSMNRGKNLMENKIKSFWNQEEFFKLFFSINGYSFWEILKPFFLELCTKRILEAIEEIEIAKELLIKSKVSSILVWSENGFNEQIIIGLAKKFGIPTVLIQHGLYDDSISSYEMNEFLGVLPNNSDKFVVWGDLLAKYALKCGISPTKIETLGSPIYDKIFERRKVSSISKKDFILLATTSTSNIVSDLMVKNRENYEKSIMAICIIISKLKKNLIIKVHPFEEEHDIVKQVKKINHKIKIKKKSDIIPLIESCEIFLALDMSTTILESQVIERPVISIIVTNDSKDASVFKSNSCIRTNVENLENELKKILYDKSYKDKIINKGISFANDYLVNHGNASKALLSFLEELE